MKPVVLVIRHPDFSDDIELYGLEADVIYIDLGSSFDGTPNDAEQAREWAESVWEDVKDLEDDHPARDAVKETITNTTDGYVSDAELEKLFTAGVFA